MEGCRHMEQKIITINEVTDGLRIDSALSSMLGEGYSRSFIQRLIENSSIFLNNKLVKKASGLVKRGDTVTVIPLVSRQIQADVVINAHIPIKVIHEDEQFLILDKPSGLLVHVPHVRSTEITLVDWIRTFYPAIGDVGVEHRPGIIHRLDKNTSGLIIIPRTHQSYAHFGQLFQNRMIQKTYLGLVSGHPSATGSINRFIGRDPHVPTKMASFDQISAARYIERGYKIRHALTTYKVMTYFSGHALVELKPVTGRTHQLRVHMSALGHPILGDSIYGNKKNRFIERQALHASALSFQFGDKDFYFSTDLPDDINQAIKELATE
jgi:23S rRNA pseudouridine1911/1915/1917 synthase